MDPAYRSISANGTRTRETGAYCLIGIRGLATCKVAMWLRSDPSGCPLERCVRVMLT